MCPLPTLSRTFAPRILIPALRQAPVRPCQEYYAKNMKEVPADAVVPSPQWPATAFLCSHPLRLRALELGRLPRESPPATASTVAPAELAVSFAEPPRESSHARYRSETDIRLLVFGQVVTSLVDSGRAICPRLLLRCIRNAMTNIHKHRRTKVSVLSRYYLRVAMESALG